MERKAIFVPSQVHKELKILSAQEDMNINEMVEKLLNFYKANK